MDFKIPTKPYLKRYLHYRYPMPYKLSLTDNLGLFVYHLLRRQTTSAFHVKIAKQYNVKYTIRIGVKYLEFRQAINLTDHTVVLFNNYVESMLKEELYKELESREVYFEATKDTYTLKTSPFTIKAGILSFLAKYNISESELSYETLKKDYYRFRKKKQKKLLTRLSPNKKSKSNDYPSGRMSA